MLGCPCYQGSGHTSSRQRLWDSVGIEQISKPLASHASAAAHLVAGHGVQQPALRVGRQALQAPLAPRPPRDYQAPAQDDAALALCLPSRQHPGRLAPALALCLPDSGRLPQAAALRRPCQRSGHGRRNFLTRPLPLPLPFPLAFALAFALALVFAATFFLMLCQVCCTLLILRF